LAATRRDAVAIEARLRFGLEVERRGALCAVRTPVARFPPTRSWCSPDRTHLSALLSQPWSGCSSCTAWCSGRQESPTPGFVDPAARGLALDLATELLAHAVSDRLEDAAGAPGGLKLEVHLGDLAEEVIAV